MNTEPLDFWPTIKRGVIGRCPKCGQGKLYKSYLKQVDVCEFCDEDLSQYRADDGPAWLTILIVGHVIVPFIVAVAKHPEWPQGILLGVCLLTTLAMVMAVLPYSKGFFIAMLWRNKHVG